MHLHIDDHRVRRAAALLIEGDGNGGVAQNFRGHYDISGIVWYDLESRPPDELLAYGFGETLFNAITCRCVGEGRYRDRLALTAIQVPVRQTISARREKDETQINEKSRLTHQPYDSKETEGRGAGFLPL